jgi:hypothetical protein
LRANDKNLIITSYAEYHHLDASNIKVKEPNHLFDVDPAARKANRRSYIDKDAVEAASTAAVSQTSMIEALIDDIFLLSRWKSQHPCSSQQRILSRQREAMVMFHSQ